MLSPDSEIWSLSQLSFTTHQATRTLRPRNDVGSTRMNEADPVTPGSSMFGSANTGSSSVIWRTIRRLVDRKISKSSGVPVVGAGEASQAGGRRHRSVGLSRSFGWPPSLPRVPFLGPEPVRDRGCGADSGAIERTQSRLLLLGRSPGICREHIAEP